MDSEWTSHASSFEWFGVRHFHDSLRELVCAAHHLRSPYVTNVWLLGAPVCARMDFFFFSPVLLQLAIHHFPSQSDTYASKFHVLEVTSAHGVIVFQSLQFSFLSSKNFE
jgi:hypothetical protein